MFVQFFCVNGGKNLQGESAPLDQSCCKV